jgi:predicted small lipoprotein YifL
VNSGLKKMLTQKRRVISRNQFCSAFLLRFSKATILKLAVAFALVMPATGCGTKTELLMPNGKPTPRDQRDPSQPPSPISR